MFKLLLLFIFVLSINLFAQQDSVKLEEGWKYWSKGDFTAAERTADEILKHNSNDQSALHLKANTLYITGKYPEAINVYNKINESYKNYIRVTKLMGEANLHFGKLQDAYNLFAKSDSSKAQSVLLRMAKPLSNKTDKTYVVPFRTDVPFANYMPAVDGNINGINTLLRMDTGGPFLIMGIEDAKKYNIELQNFHEGQQAFTKTKFWYGICDSLRIGDGVFLKNVPVEISESLKDFVIIGTNILEQFLCTIDYPNKRFIFTPRGRKDLYSSHYAMLTGNAVKMPFYLYGDHYMLAKGGFNSTDSLNFFIDSGLLVVNPEGKQAGFNASKEDLMNYGYTEAELEGKTFIDKNNKISLGNILQDDILIFYNPALLTGMTFGDIKTNGLLSHAFLSKYAWTIDFDSGIYQFNF